MKLQHGKTYVDGNGQKVTVIRKSGQEVTWYLFPSVHGEVRHYLEDGRYFLHVPLYDLVSEVPEGAVPQALFSVEEVPIQTGAQLAANGIRDDAAYAHRTVSVEGARGRWFIGRYLEEADLIATNEYAGPLEFITRLPS